MMLEELYDVSYCDYMVYGIGGHTDRDMIALQYLIHRVHEAETPSEEGVIFESIRQLHPSLAFTCERYRDADTLAQPYYEPIIRKTPTVLEDLLEMSYCDYLAYGDGGDYDRRMIAVIYLIAVVYEPETPTGESLVLKYIREAYPALRSTCRHYCDICRLNLHLKYEQLSEQSEEDLDRLLSFPELCEVWYRELSESNDEFR